MERDGQRVRIYLAGMNGARLAAALEGQDVLISYADVIRRPGVWQDRILPRLERGLFRSVILDSGAFTELTERLRNEQAIAQGKRPPHPNPLHIEIEDYADFAVEHRQLFDEIVTLDDIAGDVETTLRNTAILEDRGLEVVPVFHQGEPWSLLELYVERYQRLGIGVQRNPNGSPVKGAREWTEAALERLPDGISVHGFGMTRFAKRLTRMDTTDSTTWIAEFRAIRTTTEGTHYCRHPLVRNLDDWGRLLLVARSYLEPHRAIVPTIPDSVAKGQGRTVLQRFTPSSLRAACLELADLRFAA